MAILPKQYKGKCISNIFSCTGSLGQDAEVKELPSGVKVLNFSVANNIGYGDKKEVLWVRISVFGKKAEGRLPEFLLKGTKVFVSGELKLREYQTGEGVTKSSLDLNANVIDLIGDGSKSDNNQKQATENGNAQREGEKQYKQVKQSQQEPPQDAADYEEYNDSIPF